MYKKITAALLSVPIAAFAASAADAAEPQNLYNEPMTIKLVPSSNFDVEIHGSYQLVNQATGETVEMDNDMQFRHGEDNVTVKVSDDDSVMHTSPEGFILQEDGVSDSNYVEISSVKRAGASFQTTAYQGSFVVDPEAERSPEDAADKEQNRSDSSNPDTVGRLQLFNVLDMEDYLKGVVPSEVSASWPMAVLKAQAVAARNYAKVQMSSNEFLYDTTTHQVYKGLSGDASRTNQAIRATEGVFLEHNGTLINAYFHASSGGHTDDSENVWANEVPYIRGVDDPYDTHSSNPYTEWTKEISQNAVSEAVFPESGWVLSDLEITAESEAGRVQQMRAVGVNEQTGETQEKMLPQGSDSADSIRWDLGATLRSTKFDLSKDTNSVTVKTADGSEQSYDSAAGMDIRQSDGSDQTVAYDTVAVQTGSGVEYLQAAASSYTFTGSGYGHGLGMSQWGAYNMAQQGMSYRDILTHYYTDVNIVQR
ncbi:SpoIID/LytB domain-containing protein [Salibacterium halotolerans]|uniref:Stage II sporulation protein D n=1 Tax=Salibacterium halotolerans TaxID=1884432 RepID=A0A1I5WX00_9BACI|nr:SpoIID/LytB domain-containing protein [Salibacterium halotolerans]SFQ24305.1 stage II sporulation protein D [Salibacterium halotolerans]